MNNANREGHRLFTVSPTPITVAAKNEDDAWRYVMENYTYKDVMKQADVEVCDRELDEGEEDWLTDLDEEV